MALSASVGWIRIARRAGPRHDNTVTVLMKTITHAHVPSVTHSCEQLSISGSIIDTSAPPGMHPASTPSNTWRSARENVASTTRLALAPSASRIAISGVRRATVATILACWALAVGMTRAYLGVHWPTDVLGGWLLALAWLSIAAAVVPGLRASGVPTTGAPPARDTPAVPGSPGQLGSR